MATVTKGAAGGVKKPPAPEPPDPQRHYETKLDLSKSLIDFGSFVIGEEMFEVDSPDFHFDMDRHLRNLRQRKTLVVAPRGHAKSSVVGCLFILWHIFLEDIVRFEQGMQSSPRQRTKHIVLISKTREEAIKRLDTIKAVLGDNGEYSAALRRIWGNWGEETAKRWTTKEIILKDGTIITALGTGGQIRGIKKKHLRPTLIAVDDPEDEKNTVTDDAMETNRKWLIQGVLPSLSMGRGRIVVIGTPINTQCMVVQIQKSKGWRVLWYQNDAKTGTSKWYDSATKEWVTHEGVLWPWYITKEFLLTEYEDALSLGMLGSYYRELEAKVIGDADQIFKPEKIHSWNGSLERDMMGQGILVLTDIDGERLKRPERYPAYVTVGIDPAASTGERSDKTSIIFVAQIPDGRRFVLAQSKLARYQPDEIIVEIADLHKLIKPDFGLLEVSAAFEYIWTYLYNDHGIAYMKDKPTQKKKGEGSRLESIQPLFMQDLVFLHENQSEGRAQLLSYPRGKDDYIDGLEKALRHSQPPWHTEADQAFVAAKAMSQGRKRSVGSFRTA